jgi:hypothetical protein
VSNEDGYTLAELMRLAQSNMTKTAEEARERSRELDGVHPHLLAVVDRFCQVAEQRWQRPSLDRALPSANSGKK